MAYNPNDHTPSNKPYAVQGKPIDARTYFYDKGGSFAYYQFTTRQQILDYFPTELSRRGHFLCILNTGGTLDSNNILRGGTNQALWWDNDYTDDGLVPFVDVAIPNLQAVTTGSGNNVTSNSLQLTGLGNLNPSLESVVLAYTSGQGLFANFKPTLNSQVTLDETGGIKLFTSLLSGQSSSEALELYPLAIGDRNAGIIGAFKGRIIITPAVNEDEAVTKGQVGTFSIPTPSNESFIII